MLCQNYTLLNWGELHYLPFKGQEMILCNKFTCDLFFLKAASHRTPIRSGLQLLKPLKARKMSVPFQWQSRNCSYFYAYCVWSCTQCYILFPFHNKPNHIPNCNDVQASFWQYHFLLMLPPTGRGWLCGFDLKFSFSDSEFSLWRLQLPVLGIHTI